MLREYTAITLRRLGIRRAARRVRAWSKDRYIELERRRDQMQAWPPSGPSAASNMIASPSLQPTLIDTGAERQLQFSKGVLQSRMRMENPDALVAAYTRQMMSFLLFNPDPAHILMLGLGGGSLPKFCYRYLPGTFITVVEIDERVIAMRKSFQIPDDDERFRVVHDDGVRYLAQLDRQVDVILIDAFDESGIAPSLTSSGFYADVARRLTPDGVLIMNLLGKPQSFAVHVKRVRKAFAGRALLAIVVSNDNVLLFAFNPEVPAPTLPALSLRARYLQAQFKLPFRAYLQRIRDGE